MGLAISVGILAEMKELGEEQGYEWRRDELDAVQEFLESRGFDTWEEPEDSSQLGMRSTLLSFPASNLHLLRRAYARFRKHPRETLDPVESGSLSDDDQAIIDFVGRLGDSHLLCHSDHNGYYVPVDFADPLFAPEEYEVPGYGAVGSSYGLKDELQIIAPRIDIRLNEDGSLPDSEVQRVNNMGDTSNHRFGAEQSVFVVLWEAARVSIKENAAICFH